VLDHRSGVPTFSEIFPQLLHSVVVAEGADALLLGARQLGYRHGHYITDSQTSICVGPWRSPSAGWGALKMNCSDWYQRQMGSLDSVLGSSGSVCTGEGTAGGGEREMTSSPGKDTWEPMARSRTAYTDVQPGHVLKQSRRDAATVPWIHRWPAL